MNNKTLKKLRHKLNKTNKNLLLLNTYRTTTLVENLRRCCDALNIPYVNSDTVQNLRTKIYRKKPNTITTQECNRLITGETPNPILNIVRLALIFKNSK